MPRNSLLNGRTAPDSFGTQLDETAYPILMAWQAGLTDAGTWNHVRAAADFVVAHGPAFGVERWEEQSGFSPSTIAAEIAGLLAGARSRTPTAPGLGPGLPRHRRRHAARGQGLDGDHERTARAHPYFIRLSKTGTRTPRSATDVGNGGPPWTSGA
jgi:glucoamylase